MVSDLFVLCQTENTHPKDLCCVEPLTKGANLGSTPLDAARLQHGERVLIYLEGLSVDIITAEAVYHCSCYQEFTNKYILEHLKNTSAEKESTHTVAFNVLSAQVEKALLVDEQVMTLPAMRDQIVECLSGRRGWRIIFIIQKRSSVASGSTLTNLLSFTNLTRWVSQGLFMLSIFPYTD